LRRSDRFTKHAGKMGLGLLLLGGLGSGWAGERWMSGAHSRAGIADGPRQAGSASNLIALVNGTVIDGTGSVPSTQTILIRGDRIEAVGVDLAIPPEARRIDAAGMTVLPGLFDLHTHLPYGTASGIAGDWPKNLLAYLYCGVTSVVDFGTYPETFEPMRRLLREGVIVGPRLSLAARLTTPGGHGAEGGRGDFFSQEVATPDEARAAIRRVVAYRPDVIKVFTDGWRYGAAPDMTSMNLETLTALVEEAHREGWPVLTHTVRRDQARLASQAGVDVLAHGIGDGIADASLLELLRTNGTTYVNTLAVYEPRSRSILSPLLEVVLDPIVRQAIEPPLTRPVNGTPAGEAAPAAWPPVPGRETPYRQRRWHYLGENLRAARQAGVAIGVGTDAGVTGTHHGWATLRELELLAAGGLSPLEAITAATGTAAKALRLETERGTLAPGRLADLLVVDGEPHRQLADLRRIRHLFLGGREVDRSALAQRIATAEGTSLPTVPGMALLDDFDSPDGRSRLDTRWVYATEPGVAPSRVIFDRVERQGRGKSLLATARLSSAENPFVRLQLPFRRGGIEPVDASRFVGVSFDVRGEGTYRLVLTTASVRENRPFAASFTATAGWKTQRIPFATLQRSPGKLPGPDWTAKDLLLTSFEMAGPPLAMRWIELDNIRLY
jgi:imidazolonepropionase-like amidohydrolase